MAENRYILWMHEPPPDEWIDQYMSVDGRARGGIVFTHGLGADPNNHSSFDYTHWTEHPFELGAIARLNHGYGPHGTVPHVDLYPEFVQRVQNWVAGSRGCHHWVIGNEGNHSVEWPDGMFIDPVRYAQEVYASARAAIHDLPDHEQDIVMPMPVALWNIEMMDWKVYYQLMLEAAGEIDALCWHTYAHGSDPALIRDMTTMAPPFQDRLYNFRAYWDLWEWTPEQFQGLSIHITETDQGDILGVRNPWLDAPGVQWIQEAIEEVGDWNMTHDSLIHTLATYRWPKYDEWHIDGKPNVHADFGKAVELGITWDKEEPPVNGEWSATYENHCNDYVLWGESPPVKVLEDYVVFWPSDKPRPEMDFKEEPQPEVYEHDPPRSGVGFLPYAEFDWWMRTEEPVPIHAWVPTKLRMALMIVAHGIEDDGDKLGDCGIQIGISGPEAIELDDPRIIWSEWRTVREPGHPGANAEEYVWYEDETVEFVPSIGLAHVWIRCVANVAADISAGHFDLIQILQKSDEPPPVIPPPGTGVHVIRTVTYYDGVEVADTSVEVPCNCSGVDPLVCSLAQQIANLTCPGE